MRISLYSRALGGLCLALLLGVTSAPAILAAQPNRPVAQAAGGATLSILSPPVDVQGAGGTFASAADGQTLANGDTVQTGASGAALLTFFDGSEVQLAEQTQVRINAPATGTTGFRLEQLVGTVVHRVGQPRPAANTSYQTDGPTAISLVRGTTFVVTVHRFVDVTTSLYPRTIEGNPNLLLDESLSTDEDGNLIQTRTWQDPNTGDQFQTADNLGQYEITREALYVDQGNLIRVRAFHDLNTDETTDVFENLGPEDQSAPGSPLNTCAPTDASCVTSTILLTDANGSVGRVEFRPSAALAPLNLNQACNTGGAATQAVTQGTLVQQPCTDITQRTRNLRDAAGAQATAQQAIQVAREQAVAMGLTVPGLAPGTAPLVGPQTVRTLAPPATPTPAPSRPTPTPPAGAPTPAAPPPSPAAPPPAAAAGPPPTPPIPSGVAGAFAGGSSFHMFDVNDATQSVYLAIDGTNQVWIVNNQATAPQIVPVQGAWGVGFDAANGLLYVTNHRAPGQVTIVNAGSGSIVGTVAVAPQPAGVRANPTTNRIYVAHTGGSVTVLDGGSNAVVGSIPVGSQSEELAVNAATNRVYVANTGDNTVSVIDGDSNSVVATIPVVSSPAGVWVDPASNQVGVWSSGNGGYSLIDGATNTVIQTLGQ